MTIRLKIENVDRLPNNEPVAFTASQRSFEIGREGRDWTLPDASKFISGKHCEVRYQNGDYWLLDVSRNGTFLDGTTQRVRNPHRLQHGDRLRIGPYLVAVAIEAGSGMARPPEAPVVTPREGDQFWGAGYRAGDAGGYERMAQPSPRPGYGLENDAFLRSSAPISQPPHASEQQFARDRPLASDDLLRGIAAGAGVSTDLFMRRDPRDVAIEIGAVLRLTVEELSTLLKARAAAKTMVKSGQRTMVGAADNNPLKFVPAAEEILEIMFARRRAGYLDAKHSVEEAFRDLKTHELATYAAMQSALSRLLEELSPEAIERKVPSSSFGSKKSRAWELFAATWAAKEQANENGMLDVFLAYFAEAYAKAAKPK